MQIEYAITCGTVAPTYVVAFHPAVNQTAAGYFTNNALTAQAATYTTAAVNYIPDAAGYTVHVNYQDEEIWRCWIAEIEGQQRRVPEYLRSHTELWREWVEALEITRAERNIRRAIQRDEEARVAAVQEEAAERLRKREAANAKARALLESCLTPEQLLELRGAGKAFQVRGSKGGRYLLALDGETYALNPEGTHRAAHFCIHWTGEHHLIPLADAVLARKLLIESDEEEFLKHAHRSQFHAPYPVA